MMAYSKWNWDDALRGVIPPMISPLTEAGQVDEDAVGRVANYILDGGCSGLFVLGGTGEGAWLSTSQREAIVTSSVRAAAGRAPVLVGLMLPGTAPVVDAAHQAVDAGADALVVGSPYYFGVDAAAQRRHVEAVLSATPLPVLLYNIPQCTHIPLAREAVHALAAESRILGVKDSWGDLPYFQSLLTIKLTQPSFRVLQGSEHSAMASLLLGADGLIPGLGNIAPRVMVGLVNAARQKDLAACQRLHSEIVDLTRMYARAGIPGLYAACSLAGLVRNVPAQPWVAVESAELAGIQAILAKHDLLARAPAAV
ncbi:MAG: dihydrodipicolinate synthase family protein [Chloroflexota bacterium]|nr:dihydrodipicolinate synthase family protein [Chloroflexota bacterium]